MKKSQTLGEIADATPNIGKDNMYMNLASCKILDNVNGEGLHVLHSVISMT